VLLSLEGVCVAEVAHRVAVDRGQVARWTRRFRRWGLEGLEDEPRCGRPARITEGERARVVSMACRRPESFGRAQTLWTLNALAEEARKVGLGPISRSTVHRILQDAELRPHKVKMWCTSNDPDYERKLADVTRLYLHPPIGEAVVSIDEKSQMQALSRRVAIRRARPGRVGRQESDYKRHGTRCLLACFDVRTGEVIGTLEKQRRSIEFLAFLDRVARAYPRGRVHVVLDNLNTHYGPAVDAWNRDHGGRFVFHYTPFHASWLNQIEIFFGILSRRVLRHGEFASVQALEDAVTEFLRRWNRREAHPFRWTYRAKRSERRRRVA
jgi:transposase